METAMKVQVVDANDTLVWERATSGSQSGVTSRDYLKDGTQERIVNALLRALSHARGELGRKDADTMPNTCRATAKINDDVPVVVIWNDDPSR